MSKITRATQKIFAETASNVGQFGSGQAGTKVLTKTLSTIQSLAAWAGGWSLAVLGANKFPPIEEENALHFLETTQLAYLFQEGIPEYDADTTYYQNSIVKKSGTYEIYGSLIDDNMGNDLSDDASWLFLSDLSQSSSFSTGDTKFTYKNVADSGWIMADDSTIGNTGSGATYRGSAYEALFLLLWTNVSNSYAAVSGGRGSTAAADWAANKTMTLMLTEGRNIGIAGSGAGLTARALGQSLGDENLQAHTHSVTDPTHTHPLGYSANGSSGWDAGAGSSPKYAPLLSSTSGSGWGAKSASTGVTVDSAGTGAGQNMPPTTYLNMMIKL